MLVLTLGERRCSGALDNKGILLPFQARVPTGRL